jgi:glycosyltransferase involved in cell wall biosynthesis
MAARLAHSDAPMRVLLLHNRYRALGGEERVVAAQADLLSRHGHTVEVLERDSSAVSATRAARGLIGGGLDPDEVGAAVRRMGADVVHAHNLHPLLGWRALAAAQDAGARTLLQLHNFRLFCAIGITYRDGQPCHDCRGLDTLPGLVHRCRGSVVEAGVYAAGLALQQRRLLVHSDRLIVLSRGHFALLVSHGLPVSRASVVANFMPDGRWAAGSHADQGTHALVAGRLVEEKGFDTAIRAAAAAGVPLVVAGEGPDAPRLAAIAAETGAAVTFTGWLAAEALAQLQARAAVVMVPSRCEESFGYGVLDAAATGVPVIASPRGGLAELVGEVGGTLLDPDDAPGWATALRALWTEPERRRLEGGRALSIARTHYGEAAGIHALMAAYAEAGVPGAGDVAMPHVPGTPEPGR